MRDPVLERAFSIRGAVKRVASAAGISTAAVSQWRKVPQKHLATVAAETGIPPAELRPDLTAVSGEGQPLQVVSVSRPRDDIPPLDCDTFIAGDAA